MTKVKVDLGIDTYEIFIDKNILSNVAKFISASNFTKKILIVTDSNVEKFIDKLTAPMTDAKINFDVAIIPAGETSKNLRVAEKIFTRAIELGLDRKSPIIAFGGGVVGDLTGFVAATYLRGVPFIQVPTTLLSQVDSSVGGKTGVNHALGKNLIGAFYQPKAVFIDIDTLETLPNREIKSGLGEIVKYGIISDGELFKFLEENAEKILARDVDALTHLIKRSCEIKAEVVSQDEKENGLRRILNFGHTIGHAIEKVTSYEKYRHGEAVAIGMVGAAMLSCSLGKINSQDVARLKNLLERLQLETKCDACEVDELFHALQRDKKSIDGKVNWILMDDFGKVCVTNSIPDEKVKQILRQIQI